MLKPNEFNDALLIEKAWGTPFEKFVRSIYQQESGGGKNTKTSNQGAVGGMQIIPATFNSVADKGWDINDPFDNVRAGIRYAKQMWDKAGGDPALAAAGYYGGPGGLEKARKGIAVSDPKNPNAPNTLQYGSQVAARMGVGAGSDAPAPAAPPAVASRQAPVVEVPVAPAVNFPPAVIADPEGYAPIKSKVPQGNAWQNFVAALSKADAPSIQPVDLSFGASPTLARLTLPPAVIAPGQSQKPNFDAFRGWGSKA